MRSLRLLLTALVALSLALPAAAIAADPRQAVIVVFRDDVARPAATAAAFTRKHGTRPTLTYAHALKGFAATLPASAIRALRARADVRSVTPDTVVSLADTTQTSATWGLDRIDQRDLPLTNSYTYATNGNGVQAYVIDSGIFYGHQEFGGRAALGVDLVGDGRNGGDCHGHGTHVAGTIGGQTYGVAKSVSLFSVRVFDCVGDASWSRIIGGVDYVTGRKQANPSTPMVANMSISGPPDSAVDLAVANSIAAGVSYTIAAGNGNIFGFGVDACGVSPARVGAAMTIGASTTTDSRATFSNYGPCVDWFAPGVSVVSAGITSATATATKSGTSMSAPHTAGVAALYLQSDPTATPGEVRDALFDATSKGKITSANSANNHLLYSRVAAGPTNTPPTAAGDSYSVSSGSTLTQPAPGVLANDSDVDGDALTAVLASGPAHGTLTLAANGGFTYTPAGGFSGSDSFTYQARDTALATSAPATVTITVTGTGATSMRLADLDGTTTAGKGQKWTASVTIEVRNDLGAAVAGATVSGSFSPSGGAGRTCVTSSTGRCTITSAQLARTVGSVTFTVTSVSHATLTYTPGANSDPDGDSTGTSITLTRP